MYFDGLEAFISPQMETKKKQQKKQNKCNDVQQN